MLTRAHFEGMKRGTVAIAALFCLILSASPALAASARADSSSSAPLSLGLSGMIVNAGQQHYTMRGGALVSGSIEGSPLAQSDTVDFSLNAMVHGLGTTGVASLAVMGADGAVVFSAQIPIGGEVAAAVFPLDPVTFANCNPNTEACNSEIPVLFIGIATVHILGMRQPLKIPFAIESPYWNPAGGPIVIAGGASLASPDFAFVVAYTTATIDWTGVQLQGLAAGTLGTNPVNGYYAQSVNSHEDLVAGTEQDLGSIAFTGMSNTVLNARGTFSGQTTISYTGSQDCSSEFGLPSGTCLATGATSMGAFQMVGGRGAKIAGTYGTEWSVPSLFTATLVTAAVFQH